MDTASLIPWQQAIVPIVSLTDSGDTDPLDKAPEEGLSAGLFVNEIKKIMVQLYAYAGSPRCLNALTAFSDTLEARRSQGIHDDTGRNPVH